MASIYAGDPPCPACGNSVHRFWKSNSGAHIGCDWCGLQMPLYNAVAIANGTFKLMKKHAKADSDRPKTEYEVG